jgi:hypothetical protein
MNARPVDARYTEKISFYKILEKRVEGLTHPYYYHCSSLLPRNDHKRYAMAWGGCPSFQCDH